MTGRAIWTLLAAGAYLCLLMNVIKNGDEKIFGTPPPDYLLWLIWAGLTILSTALFLRRSETHSPRKRQVFKLEYRLWTAIAIAFIFAEIAFHTMDHMKLHLMWPWGYLNYILILGIVFWYLLDRLLSRREIYELADLYEGRLRLWVRMLRILVLLFCLLLAIASAVAAKLEVLSLSFPDAGAEIGFNSSRSLVLLSGIAIAALGWMFANHQKQQSDRAASTLKEIHEQLGNPNLVETYVRLMFMVGKISKSHNIAADDKIPMDVMNILLSRYTKKMDSDNVKLSLLVDRFFNALNQLALGVRQGQFDFKTIELILRPRFVRQAFRFSDYIAEETKAFSHKDRRYSSTRTWEHFLWLVTKLPKYDLTLAQEREIVLPPRIIYDTKSAGSKPPPRTAFALRIKEIANPNNDDHLPIPDDDHLPIPKIVSW